MKSTQELTDNPDHIKNYRPKVLVLTGQGHYLLLSVVNKAEIHED